MSCAKTINQGTGCNGYCTECGRARRGKFREVAGVFVLIRIKSLLSAPNHNPVINPYLTCKH